MKGIHLACRPRDDLSLALSLFSEIGNIYMDLREKLAMGVVQCVRERESGRARGSEICCLLGLLLHSKVATAIQKIESQGHLREKAFKEIAREHRGRERAVLEEEKRNERERKRERGRERERE